MKSIYVIRIFWMVFIIISPILCKVNPAQATSLLYFNTSNNPSFVGSVELDGSNLQTITSGSLAGIGLSIDHDSGKIYYFSNGLFRANLDGSNKEFISNIGEPDFELDFSSDKIYSTANDRIYRMNLDGSGVETLINIPDDFFSGIALDLSSQKMYFYRI